MIPIVIFALTTTFRNKCSAFDPNQANYFWAFSHTDWINQQHAPMALSSQAWPQTVAAKAWLTFVLGKTVLQTGNVLTKKRCFISTTFLGFGNCFTQMHTCLHTEYHFFPNEKKKKKMFKGSNVANVFCQQVRQVRDELHRCAIEQSR